MPKIKVLYLRAGVDEEPEIIEIERDDVESKQRLIDCNAYDIVIRKIRDKDYFIICDDEGCLKENPIVSGLGDMMDIAFVGNLLICGVDVLECGEIDLGSLTQEDVKKIKKEIVTYTRINKKTGERSKARAVLVSTGGRAIC